MQTSEKICAYLMDNIPQHPSDIVTIAADHFKVSRMTIHRYLTKLFTAGQINKSGTTRQIQYTVRLPNHTSQMLDLTHPLQETQIWEKQLAEMTQSFSQNIIDILEYGFTEILNNAIDHSQGKKIEYAYQCMPNKESIVLSIQDDGIGVFNRIKHIHHFETYKECLLHLTKGKLTTDPINHSGEGLFFTSRVFDEFYLEANGLLFYKNNIEQDWTIEKSAIEKGTKVTMSISSKSTRLIKNVFDNYTSEEDFSFNKTDLLVDLSQLEGERLISRSQAKRLISRLEPFTRITLDFSKIRSVGQGFVDEIFRVYPLKHPKVYIQYIHANEDVEFMIKRGLS